MKRNLLTVAAISFGVVVTAQNVISHVDTGGIFFVGENALVYNGGGAQTKGNGVYDIRGNVMIVGTTTDSFKTLNASGLAKTDGGNFVLRLNTPSTFATSTYGQLYINGLTQGNISGVVDKEFRARKHGTYQQIALPFYNKAISSLSGTSSTIGTLGKTFSNIRYSKNEVLTWNNATAVSDNFNVSSLTPKSNTYYMLGSLGLDTSTPPATMPANFPSPNGTVYTLKGTPFTNGGSELLRDAADGVNFGTGGNAINAYNERYNTYLQDDWDYVLNPSNPWSTVTFGRNIYQFGNPYFTNLDLSLIGITESGTITDNNAILSIKGIRYDPGTVVSSASAGTYSVAAQFINFTAGSPVPVGDVGTIIKPMQTFVIKLDDNAVQIGTDKTLSFDNLRRFKNDPRANGTNYSVTANKNASENNGTVKQLGIIGLDQNGAELARTYYAVYPTAITGQTTQRTVQSILGSQNILGTYEEDINGGVDHNYENNYWLYINEANENDFLGKAIPLALYSSEIKSLKFEVRENTDLIQDGVHDLSTGIGFYYKAQNGEISEIAQNQVIPVTVDQYSLYYGKRLVLSTDTTTKLSRTMVVYNRGIDKFVVRFDPLWKKSDIIVYDMSGKVIVSQKNVSTDQDFEINLSKMNSAYIVTAVSEKGEKISSKIIR